MCRRSSAWMRALAQLGSRFYPRRIAALLLALLVSGFTACATHAPPIARPATPVVGERVASLKPFGGLSMLVSGADLLGSPLILGGAQLNLGGGGHIVQDEGVDLTAAGRLNFTGAGVTCSTAVGVTTCNLGALGGGDVAGAAASVDSELPLYSATSGKLLKRSNTLSGIVELSLGVVSVLGSSGTGDVARVGAPVFTGAPTITDFTNMNHSHSQALLGGNLDPTLIFLAYPGSKIPVSNIPDAYIQATGVTYTNLAVNDAIGLTAGRVPAGNTVAPLASPALTGNPTSATAPAADDSDTSIPNTAWVQGELAQAGWLTTTQTNATVDTYVCDFYFEAPVAGDDGAPQCYVPVASHITFMHCDAGSGTQVVNLYDRAPTSPNSGTTELIGDLTCGTGGANSGAINVAIAANRKLALGLQAGFTVGLVRAHVVLTKD